MASTCPASPFLEHFFNDAFDCIASVRLDERQLDEDELVDHPSVQIRGPGALPHDWPGSQTCLPPPPGKEAIPACAPERPPDWGTEETSPSTPGTALAAWLSSPDPNFSLAVLQRSLDPPPKFAHAAASSSPVSCFGRRRACHVLRVRAGALTVLRTITHASGDDPWRRARTRSGRSHISASGATTRIQHYAPVRNPESARTNASGRSGVISHGRPPARSIHTKRSVREKIGRAHV